MTRARDPRPSEVRARIAREERTIEAMVRLYCRAKHGGTRTCCCEECRTLLDYARCRLDRCPFGADKTACVDCPIHCYKPAMRAKIKEVMKYAGPRMVFRHPILAFFHLRGGRRRPSAGPASGSGSAPAPG